MAQQCLVRSAAPSNLKLFNLCTEIVGQFSDTAVLQFVLGCKEVHYFLRFMRNAEYIIHIDEYLFPVWVPIRLRVGLHPDIGVSFTAGETKQSQCPG
jgi:hypothetical protein